MAGEDMGEDEEDDGGEETCDGEKQETSVLCRSRDCERPADRRPQLTSSSLIRPRLPVLSQHVAQRDTATPPPCASDIIDITHLRRHSSPSHPRSGSSSTLNLARHSLRT